MASVYSLQELAVNPSVQLTALPFSDISVEEVKTTILNGRIHGYLYVNKCNNEVIELTQIFTNTFIAPCSNILVTIKCKRTDRLPVYCNSGFFLSYRMGYE